MVLATKPEASSNFQATMADCSYLDSDSASGCPPKRKSLQLTKATWTEEFDFISNVKGESHHI